jgi:hypothetical protein
VGVLVGVVGSAVTDADAVGTDLDGASSEAVGRGDEISEIWAIPSMSTLGLGSSLHPTTVPTTIAIGSTAYRRMPIAGYITDEVWQSPDALITQSRSLA